MTHVIRLALSVAVAALLAAAAHAEDVSTKKIQIKDDADPGRQRLSFLSADAGIQPADGYIGATTSGISLHVFSLATSRDVCFQVAGPDCQLRGADADVLKCRNPERSVKILLKPGKAKAKLRGGTGWELDALASQLPVVMVLRAGSASYCALCGDGGSDVVVKDGSDGTQVLAKTCEAVACPAEPTACDLPLARPEDPVVLTTPLPLVGIAPNEVVAFRWAGGWRQIPVQVDERAMVSFDDVYNAAGFTGCPTCGGGFTRLDYTDPGTFTGADADATLDADDEIVFMASDTGARAATASVPTGTVTGSGVEVAVVDPTPPGTGFVYLFEQDGSLDPGAGRQYVAYQFDLSSGDYKTTYNINDGPNAEDTTVTTVAYARHFSDRWAQDELHVFAGGATGVDILDRHKEDILACFRTEDTFDDQEGAFVVNRAGPVRALRSYVGANSGPRTQRQHLFYRAREDNTTFLRVHAIPGVLYDFIDYSPAAAGMTFHDNNNLAGLAIDGVPDTFTPGALDWQLVTGVQGSVTMAAKFVTDIPGFVNTSTYEDDTTPSGTQCTGDAFAYGASGVRIEGTGANLPNTDPVNPSPKNFTATRFIYYDAPGLTVADAQKRRAWALNPLGVITNDWP
jgi:hypothetical protein